MHIHKMFKRMHKRHGGPPPPMCHGPPMYHGMWPPHMMPKPHEMFHHQMPKPHEMWPHMPPKMQHKLQKMQHKMHKKHHHKKHHGRPSSSSSSSSSSSESEDESLVDGIDKVQIDVQQNKDNPGDEAPAPPCNDGDIRKEKFKCKKDKHFKHKDKKEKCKYKKMHKDVFSPCWMQCSSMREPPCRDSRYCKGMFHLPPPESSPNETEQGRAQTEQNAPDEGSPQVQIGEATGQDKSRITGQRSIRRVQRRGDSVDYFMQSIAEQLKKLPEHKIAEAKLKILEVVNGMQMDKLYPDLPEQDTSAVDMVIENQQSQEPQPGTHSES